MRGWRGVAVPMVSALSLEKGSGALSRDLFVKGSHSVLHSYWTLVTLFTFLHILSTIKKTES